MLTFAVLPDPDPAAPAAPLRIGEIARGNHAARPAPPIIATENVAAHAVRHLALIAQTDPVVAKALESHPCLQTRLGRCAPVPAGELRPIPGSA